MKVFNFERTVKLERKITKLKRSIAVKISDKLLGLTQNKNIKTSPVNLITNKKRTKADKSMLFC